MSGLFSKSKHNATEEPRIASLQYQTSNYGGVIPVVYGSGRVSVNLLWYGNFTAIPHTTTTEVGKGGGGGSTQTSTTWTYTADVILGLCEGPVAEFFWLWRDKEAIAGIDPVNWVYSNFLGTAAQSPWGQIAASGHPEQSLGYGGTAYLAAAALDLGGSATVKNHTVCVVAAPSTWVGSRISWWQPANPVLIAQDVLTNPAYGMGWPASMIDTASWSDAALYCRASYLWISVVFQQAQAGLTLLGELFRLANCSPVWSGGKLKLIPFGDQVVSSGQGFWSPNSTPLYALTNDDFLTGGPSEDPVRCTVRPQADSANQVKAQFINPLTEFSDEVVTAEDLGDIDKFGLRLGQDVRLPICDPPTARRIAQLVLQRSLNIRRTFEFKLGWRYALLEPMDLVTITDSNLGLENEPVRIMQVEETEDGEINVTAEEWPFGTATAVAYAAPGGQGGGTVDPAAAPDPTSAPVIIEPPLDLTSGVREVWIGAHGMGTEWGGAEIWASLDGASYQRVGSITSPARLGSLQSTTGSFPGGVDDLTTVWTLALSGPGAQVSGCSATDWAAFATLSAWVEPATGSAELFAYRDATLVGPGLYDLAAHKRGLFGTVAAAHPVGRAFLRLDSAVAKLPADRWAAGQTLHLKLASFNRFGGQVQPLSEVAPTSYTLRTTPAGMVAPGTPTLAITSTVPA